MNDEYLWQKTGEDPETRRLEDALAVFRYREDDPPAVPIATKPLRTRRWRFALAFAVPAFAAAAVAAVIWFPVTPPSDEVTFIYYPEPEIREQPVAAPAPVIRPSEPAKQPVRRGEVQPTVASLRHRAVTRLHPQRTGTVALTEEERYAYHQLMLALSISSSKLNVVRNTINGVEQTDNDTKQNDR